MNKRGVEERQVIYVFYIILCILVAAFLYGRVNAESKGDLVHQIYYTRDIGLALNLFGNGNLTVYYPLARDFNFAIGDGKVAVRKEDTALYHYSDGEVSYEKKDNQLIIKKK